MSKSEYPARKPWRAALLSLFVPGLGHVYVGRLPRGVLVFAAVLGVAFAGGLIMLVPVLPPVNTLLGGAMIAVAVVLAPVDAWRQARVNAAPVRQPYQRWYVYVAGAALAVLVVQPSASAGMRALARSYEATSGVMVPALLEGDYFLSTRVSGYPARGAVVIFTWPSFQDLTLLRVVGLPGDTLSMESGILAVNGSVSAPAAAALSEPDGYHAMMDWQRSFAIGDSQPYEPTRDNWGPLVVPDGQVFVLGDNRGQSLDSRYRGFVNASDVRYQARTIYFSRDRTDRRVRWERIGHAVQ